MELSDEQIGAVDSIVDSDKSCFVLTGDAGTGKSTVVRHLVSEYPNEFTLAATTGRAAMNIGGITVDSLFCFNRDKWIVWSHDYLARVMQKCAPTVIIDEASMIGFNMATLIHGVARSYQKRLVLVGDWAQCRPVQDDWPFASELFVDCGGVRLKNNYRQHDQAFIAALNDLRDGVISRQETVAELSGRIVPDPPESDQCVRLYATNALADDYNHRRLWELSAQTGIMPSTLECSISDCRSARAKESNPLTLERRASLVMDSGLADDMNIMVGARVLITRNAPSASVFDVDRAYVNGDSGVVSDLEFLLGGELRQWSDMSDAERQEASRRSPSSVTVLLDRTNDGIELTRLSVVKKNAFGSQEFCLTGFPLRLGWSCTVHRAQGASIRKLWVDMDSVADFPLSGRHGVAYVALSRVFEPDGLHINSLTPEAIYCDPAVRHMI